MHSYLHAHVSPRAIARLLGGAVLCLSAGAALACTEAHSPRTINLSVDMLAADAPGTTRVASATAQWMSNCDVGQVQPLRVSLEAMGLTPVSSVVYRGKTYTTYELGPTSPLFFFPVNVKTSNPGVVGGYELVPAAEGTGTPVNAAVGPGDQMLIYPHVGVVKRAGMQSVDATVLGTEVVQHTRFPLSLRNTLNVTVNVKQPTCQLSDAGFTLADVSADVLGATGSSREETFPVQMRCEATGVPVRLTLTDANAPGATGSLLMPTANATAVGVQVELLRNGVPVVLGQQWTHGTGGAGWQHIDLQARYTRVGGALKVGVVEGQAVLTADYH
ncbi:fimbrial protein [Stenotrophomonas maltophilia]|uniref:fimbrial protein n=1 Tax=Stenotrophomonas maltophilia TaxID=40324 RepID=UPI0039C02C0A